MLMFGCEDIHLSHGDENTVTSLIGQLGNLVVYKNDFLPKYQKYILLLLMH